jgi:RNA polymerase sigma-70 factor, ECF subfamily
MRVRHRPPDASTDQTGDLAERRAVDDLFTATYEELRRLARRVGRDDPRGALSPTTLVNEAWLKLARSPRFVATSPLHFKRIAARAMRQVLVEAARRRGALKRGGADAVTFVALDETADVPLLLGHDLLALDRSLDELSRVSPRQAQMVEARFFGGFDVAETAALLDVSEATVLRDWRAARAWLATAIRPTD